VLAIEREETDLIREFHLDHQKKVVKTLTELRAAISNRVMKALWPSHSLARE